MLCIETYRPKETIHRNEIIPYRSKWKIILTNHPPPPPPSLSPPAASRGLPARSWCFSHLSWFGFLATKSSNVYRFKKLISQDIASIKENRAFFHVHGSCSV